MALTQVVLKVSYNFNHNRKFSFNKITLLTWQVIFVLHPTVIQDFRVEY